MEILRKIKENIKEAKELENIVKFRQTTSGKLLMRLKKKTQSSEKQSVEELTEGTKVKTFKNTNDRIMYIRDIDGITEEAEVKRGITNNGIAVEKVEVTEMRPTRDGNQWTELIINEADLAITLTKGRICVGLLLCRGQKKTEVVRC